MSGGQPTLGSLVDHLIVVSMKLWAVQDKVNLAARTDRGIDPVTTRQLFDLNLDRNQTMTEIDQLLAESVKTGTAKVDPRIKLTGD